MFPTNADNCPSQTIVGLATIARVQVRTETRGQKGMTRNEAFGAALREIRRLKNKSQDSLAFDAGLDRTYISLLERGQRSPTLDTMLSLCIALDVRFSQLALRIEDLLGSETNK